MTSQFRRKFIINCQYTYIFPFVPAVLLQYVSLSSLSTDCLSVFLSVVINILIYSNAPYAMSRGRRLPEPCTESDLQSLLPSTTASPCKCLSILSDSFLISEHEARCLRKLRSVPPLAISFPFSFLFLVMPIFSPPPSLHVGNLWRKLLSQIDRSARACAGAEAFQLEAFSDL